MNGSTVLDRRPERLEDVAAWAQGLTPDEVAAVLPSLWADVCHEVRDGTGKLRDAARVGVALAAALGHARVVRGGRGAFRGESAEATRRPGGGDQWGATSGGRTAARGRPVKDGEGLAGMVAAEIVAAVLAGGVGRCLQLKAAMGERYGQQYLRQRVAELLRKDPRVRVERRGLPLWVVPAGAPAWRGTRVEREAAKAEGEVERQGDQATRRAGEQASRRAGEQASSGGATSGAAVRSVRPPIRPRGDGAGWVPELPRRGAEGGAEVGMPRGMNLSPTGNQS